MHSNDSLPADASAGYRLGDPIALEDLLALPPDGRRYTRDSEGRLALMSPDRARTHRHPLARLVRLLNLALAPPWYVVPQPSLALPRLLTLSGGELPESRLGRRAIEPDVAVFAARPELVAGSPAGSPEGWELYSTAGLRLVIEVLSPRTARADLGRGAADVVDRWRSYRANGVPEYWVLGLDEEGPLPARSGLFCAAGASGWEALGGEGLEHAEGEVNGLRPIQRGKVASRAVRGLVLDLDAFWADATL